MKSYIVALSALLTFTCSASAVEQGSKGQLEISPFFGAARPDAYGLNDPRNAPIVGIRLGHYFTDAWSGEFSLQRTFSERNSDSRFVYLDSIRLNVLYSLATDVRLQPFFTGGFGLERFKSQGIPDENDFGLNAGAGLRLFLTEEAGLRFDWRYVSAKVSVPGSQWQQNFETTLGLFFLLGKNNQAPKKVAASKPKPKKDSDGDGVMDDMDKCAKTPKGTSVDKKGCPLKTKSRGALEGVAFKLNSADLTQDAEKVLEDVAADLKKFPSVNVEIQGHSDTMGDDSYNLYLSEKRAQTVRSFLINKGVKAERLTAKGYGETAPVADNSTLEGRRKNRRVELKWLD